MVGTRQCVDRLYRRPKGFFCTRVYSGTCGGNAACCSFICEHDSVGDAMIRAALYFEMSVTAVGKKEGRAGCATVERFHVE